MTTIAPEAAESAVLTSILMDPPCIADVSDILQPHDFGVQDYGTIYGAMIACHSRGQRPDFVTVTDVLSSQDSHIQAGDISELLTRADPWMVSSNIGGYAGIVVTASRKRTVIRHATDLISQIHSTPDADPVELAHMALQRIGELSDSDDGPVMYSDVIEKLQERLTLQHAGEWEERLFRTGLADLDRQMGGGLRGGDLVYLAGRPGSGKTALALQMMHNGARRNDPVLLFSGEMSVGSLIERGISEISGYGMDVVRKPVLPRDQYEALMRASERMAGMPVGIDATSGIKTAQMLIRAQRFQRKHGLSAVFFDYVELAGDTTKEGETQRLGEISRALKRMAITLDVPVIALSQLNRNVEQRNPPTPRMSDLRQSGALEQDADAVWLLYRHDYYVQQNFTGIEFKPEKAGVADIIVGKHRNGATATVSVHFDEATMRFQNLTRSDE